MQHYRYRLDPHIHLPPVAALIVFHYVCMQLSFALTSPFICPCQCPLQLTRSNSISGPHADGVHSVRCQSFQSVHCPCDVGHWCSIVQYVIACDVQPSCVIRWGPLECDAVTGSVDTCQVLRWTRSCNEGQMGGCGRQCEWSGAVWFRREYLGHVHCSTMNTFCGHMFLTGSVS